MLLKSFHPNTGLIMVIESSQLLLLLNWMSPAFPIGAYAYSHGLEWAIEHGDVKSAADVETWITDVINHGSGWNDAVIFANIGKREADELNELALALCSSQERYLETTQLGAAFQIAARVFVALDNIEGDIAYPVAAALSCRAIKIDSHHALLAFLQGFSNSLISVAVRLVPIGQMAGLEIIRNLMPVISATAIRAGQATLDDLGSNTLLADIASMKHETQQSRIFRT
jgi:urease accessory protein